MRYCRMRDTTDAGLRGTRNAGAEQPSGHCRQTMHYTKAWFFVVDKNSIQQLVVGGDSFMITFFFTEIIGRGDLFKPKSVSQNVIFKVFFKKIPKSAAILTT
jgi:hypothetical protein